MKKLFMFIITALFLCVLAAACKKDKNDTDGTPIETYAKLDSVIDYSTGYISDITIYKYDSKGRVERILYKDGSFDSLISSSVQVLWKPYWPNGSLDYVDVFVLDSRGLAITVNPYSKALNKSAVIHMRERLDFKHKKSGPAESLREYDANKYLTKETECNYYYEGDTLKYLYTITNGNVSNMYMTLTDQYNPYVITETFFYYTDKKNTIGDQNRGITFLGKQNNNLLKTLIYDEGSYYTPDTIQYNYKFDAKNRVVMLYVHLESGNYIDSTRYTYKD